jgi:hypothetical protein
MLFKKRKPTEVINKTITILDSKSGEELDVIDIVQDEEDIEELLIDGNSKEDLTPVLTDSQNKDLETMSTLREQYKDIEDFDKFLLDACTEKKKILDESVLTDEQKQKEQEAVEKLAKSQKVLAEKALADAKVKQEELLNRQQKIEEAERAKHEAARKI